MTRIQSILATDLHSLHKLVLLAINEQCHKDTIDLAVLADQCTIGYTPHGGSQLGSLLFELKNLKIIGDLNDPTIPSHMRINDKVLDALVRESNHETR